MSKNKNEQQTIKKEGTIEGVGLHTGEKVKLTFKPSLPNSGINFKRIDLPEAPIIPAKISNVLSPDRRLRRTSIGKDGVEVHTIEHVMAALSGLKIDNVLIELDGKELPGLDGSVEPFINTLTGCGIKEQDTERKFLTVNSPIWTKEDDASIVILPDRNFSISYTLDYDNYSIPSQHVNYSSSNGNFIEQIASSRTFCLKKEVESLKKKGLGKGANYENTVVVGNKGVVDNELRVDDEFANHKILDLIGDLYLLGSFIKGRVVAVKSGHALNIKLLHKLEKYQERIERGGIKSPEVVTEGEELDVKAIHKVLPHRYPFLLVDKILKLEDKCAVGIKNVTANEHFFQGHFPDEPVMPGVLIIEALAQVAGVLMLSKPENRGKMAYFMSIDKVKFRKTVLPGDQLKLKVEVEKVKTKTGRVHTKAFVEDKVVAQANLMFALVPG